MRQARAGLGEAFGALEALISEACPLAPMPAWPPGKELTTGLTSQHDSCLISQTEPLGYDACARLAAQQQSQQQPDQPDHDSLNFDRCGRMHWQCSLGNAFCARTSSPFLGAFALCGLSIRLLTCEI